MAEEAVEIGGVGGCGDSRRRMRVVLIPAPAVGHLVSALEVAKLLLTQGGGYEKGGLSITMLLMKLPYDNPKVNSYSETLPPCLIPEGLSFVDLPLDESSTTHLLHSVPRYNWLSEMMNIHKPTLRRILLSDDNNNNNSTRTSSVVVDMFCTPFLDIVHELALPSYVFFTSGAGFLGLIFHLQSLHQGGGLDFAAEAELDVPCFVNRVPVKALPSEVLDNKTGPTNLLTVPRRFRETKGILVNTFAELEPHAIERLLLLQGEKSNNNIPRIYPVGPLLNLENGQKVVVAVKEEEEKQTIFSWLDSQPESSVVYLCFGSMVAFKKNQTREIALALERANCRFLWSLRRALPKPKLVRSADVEEEPDDLLPEGFLDRTADVGMVIGWAPQIAVLSHPAVGGFVSHCGWNSVLESLWFGVPIATWPVQAEQHINAFELVRELEIAVEIKKTQSQIENDVTMTSDEIENAIRLLMDPIQSLKLRNKVKQLKEKSRDALQMGGSSHSTIAHFIEDLMNSSN